MKNILLRELACYRNRPASYLSLPYGGDFDANESAFRSDCPPLLCLGGGTLDLHVPRALVVSLEPLYDSKTFEQQLRYIRGDGKNTGIDDTRYANWNLDFFKVFPDLFNAGKSTSYWGDIGALVAGWLRMPRPDTVPWSELGRAFLELPLIPMHAKRHITFSSLHSGAQTKLRTLFDERLEVAIREFNPAIVLALGVDGVMETARALSLPDDLLDVPIVAYQPEFGKSRDRYQREIKASRTEKRAVILRRAPFTDWHKPNRAGIHAIGTSLRDFADQQAV